MSGIKFATRPARIARPGLHNPGALTSRTCALSGCSARQYVNGVCRRHSGQMERVYARFIEVALELVELHSKSGVHAAQEPARGIPFFTLATRFINQAAASWSTSLAGFEALSSSADRSGVRAHG